MTRKAARYREYRTTPAMLLGLGNSSEISKFREDSGNPRGIGRERM
jgi:hypothetical protein